MMDTVWMLIFVWTSALFSAEPGDVLLQDDFDRPKYGPIDAQKWEMAHGAPPVCDGGRVINLPQKIWSSKRTFSTPVSVEFREVFIAQSPKSPNNQLGLAPGGHGPDMVVWALDGSVEPKLLVPLRHVAGKDFWREGYQNAVKLSNLPDITESQNAVNLRIDWWPGKKVRFFLNGEMVVEFTTHVPDVAAPAAVRDESVYFRIGAIKVTALPSEEKVLEARAKARIAKLAQQFPKLRMVIGGPCYMWGIDPQIESELKAAGMEVLSYPNVPLIDPEQSARITRDPMEYNIIIFGDAFLNKSQPDPNTGEIPKRIRDQIPLLLRFLEAGGGIWFSGLGNEEWGRGSHALNYILKELDLGAEVVGEVVMDTAVMKQGSRLGSYAWADVMRNPLTEGVENLLHPFGVIAAEGSMGVVPIVKLSPEWQVLVKGRPTAASFPYDPNVLIGNKLLTRAKTVKSAPILAAARQAGRGSVVLWPTWSNFTVTGGSGGMLVDGERDGRWSDGARLIENLLCWLAEPSQGSASVGTFDPKKYEQPKRGVDIEERLRAWRRAGRQDYPRQFKGLIGAHSNLSDGKSSPDEMIAAAKDAGYDFIAFTEDFAKMSREKWRQLLAACGKANADDRSLVAYPGLDFIDEAGNRCIVFGNRYWIKDEWRSKENPDRIRWWYNLTYKADANPKRWPPRVIVCSRTNNKRPWNQGLWSFFAAYCYEGGKLVDDSFAEWRPLIGRHAFFLNTGVMVVHTARSTEDIAASAKEGLYQSYVRANDLPQVLSRISGCVAPGFMCRRPAYISAGPEILDFATYAAVMGGEVSFDLAAPGNDRGLLHILVQADAGLKEVSVYDGERLVRRFLPKGNRFETFMTFHPDSCHCYSLTVTDKLGRMAISWNAFLQIQEEVHRRCGDNWNWMTTGKGPGTMKPPRLPYHHLEVTYGWKPRGTGNESSRRLYWCEQGSYHHGGLSAAVNGYIRPHGLLVDGKPWPVTYPAMTLDFATVGRYGIVLTNIVRDEMLAPKREPSTTGAFSGPYKVTPSPWPADLKQFVPMQRPDGATINRYQGKVRFVKKVVTPDGKPLRLTLGATGNPTAKIVEIMNPDDASVRHDVDDGSVSGEIPVGGYVCWYDTEGDGVGGVIALTPGIYYSYTRKWQECFLFTPSPVNPGTEVTWDVIFVGGDSSTVNSNAQMEDVRVGLGIAGRPTLYKVQSRIGEVVDQKYFLTLQAEDNGFSGRIVKAAGRPLPIHLPVMIRGLNPRWDAAIWYRGETHLHTPAYYRDRWGVETWRWVVAAYKQRIDEIRYIAVLDGGVGYCQVDTDKQDSDVFIGNLLTCNYAEVFITVIKAEKGGCMFEINNPTDREIVCTVRPSRGFEFTGRWVKQLTLPPGGTVTVVAGAPVR